MKIYDSARIREFKTMQEAVSFCKASGRPIVVGLIEDSKVWRLFPSGKAEYQCEFWSSQDQARRDAIENCSLSNRAEDEEERIGEDARDDQAWIDVCLECGQDHFVCDADLTEAQKKEVIERCKRALANSLQRQHQN